MSDVEGRGIGMTEETAETAGTDEAAEAVGTAATVEAAVEDAVEGGREETAETAGTGEATEAKEPGEIVLPEGYVAPVESRRWTTADLLLVAVEKRDQIAEYLATLDPDENAAAAWCRCRYPMAMMSFAAACGVAPSYLVEAAMDCVKRVEECGPQPETSRLMKAVKAYISDNGYVGLDELAEEVGDARADLRKRGESDITTEQRCALNAVHTMAMAMIALACDDMQWLSKLLADAVGRACWAIPDGHRALAMEIRRTVDWALLREALERITEEAPHPLAPSPRAA